MNAEVSTTLLGGYLSEEADFWRFHCETFQLKNYGSEQI